MKKFLKTQLGRLASNGVYLATQPWSKSLDVKIAHYDLSANPARDEFTENCIFAFWHEYILLPTMIWGNSKITLFVSQHRDADWLVNTAHHIGFDSIRGSSTRGGPSAIRACKEKLKTHSIGVTPDGPKGPRRQMALGAIYLASRLQRPLVPVGFGYQTPYRLGTWDQFAIPRPGSRVRAILGPKIHVPPKATREELEQYRLSVTHDINTLCDTCEQAAETGKAIDKETIFQYTRHNHYGNSGITFSTTSSPQFDLRFSQCQARHAA
ncbi:MAG: lysophospholipid acyltransferase family protein [Planctomycetota bacterium]|nr:lysophospholipid acyltransferase family protein [Planctomycetota bacterium]